MTSVVQAVLAQAPCASPAGEAIYYEPHNGGVIQFSELQGWEFFKLYDETRRRSSAARCGVGWGHPT